MQEIIVAKLLARHGSKAMLPQPLSPGEFGVVDDTKEVYVGIDPTSNTGSFLPIIDAYYFANANFHATQVIQNYVFQIALTDPSITLEEIEALIDLNQNNGFIRLVKKVNTRAYISYEYKYNVGVLEIPQLPGLGIGTEQTVGAATGKNFDSYSFDLSGLSYTWEDTGAIASLINYAFVSTNGIKGGLVNVRQNLKILTENDYYAKNSYQFDLIAGTNLTLPISFMLDEANTYDMLYTASNVLLSYNTSRKCLVTTNDILSTVDTYSTSTVNDSAVIFTLSFEIVSNMLVLKYTSNSDIKLQINVIGKYKSYI